MDDSKGTATPQAIERTGHKTWERLILGENSINGTLRVVLYIGLFVVVFGLLFQFLR